MAVGSIDNTRQDGTIVTEGDALEFNIPPRESDLLANSDNFLTSNRFLESNIMSNLLSNKTLHKGLLAYTALGAAPRIIRNIPGIQGLLSEARFQSNKIHGFYDAGAGQVKKLGLVAEHMGYTPKFLRGNIVQEPNNIQEIQKLIKNYNKDISATAKYTKSGFARNAIIELDKVANLKIGTPEGVAGTNQFTRAYNTKLDPTNINLVNKIDNAIKTGKTRFGSIAQVNFEIDKYHRQALNLKLEQQGRIPYGLSQADRNLRHELAKTELVKHVTTGKNVDYETLRRAGIDKPIRSKAGHFFKNHKEAQNAWKLGNLDNITISKVVNANDHKILISAAKNDAQFKIADYVYKNANLNDPKSIAKHAYDRAGTLATKAIDRIDRLHGSSGGGVSEAKRFLNNYKLTNDSKMIVNYSPANKPHYLFGGTNANVILSKGRDVETSLKDITSGKKTIKPQHVAKSGRGLGTVVHHEILVSDQYDVIGSMEKRKHIGYAHTSTKESIKNNFAKNASKIKLSSTEELMNAIKNKDFNNMVKYSKKIGRKGVYKVAGRLGPRHPGYQLFKLAVIAASKGKIKL